MKKWMWVAGAALIGVLLTGQALAQTQNALNAQAGKSSSKADAALNAAYKQLMARYTPDEQAALKASETAWIKYRDADCRFESMGVDGGSAQPMIYSGCVEDLTNERVKHLKYQISCQEGDLSCVHHK